MFGKKKSSEKPVAKAASKSGKGFNAQEFLLFHAEKFVFGLIALLAIGLIYLGARTPAFDSQKDPANLSQKSQDTLKQISENHWDAIRNEEDRVKGVTDVSYAAKAVESTTPTVPVALVIEPVDTSRARERRADPDIFPPIRLEPKYFYGPIVTSSSSPQHLAAIDFLSKLKDAKVKEEPKKDPPRGKGGPGGGNAQDYSGGPPGGFGTPGGPGGGKSSPDAKRFLAQGYDRGFPAHTLAPPADKKKSVGARDVGFVSVVALAPHQQLEMEYRSKLARAGSIMPGRDTPNYVGFEVQRVDVTEDPSKEILETDWQPLPNAGSEIFKDRANTSWLGKAEEVLVADWTESNLTMPIPPVLLKDYRPYVTHSEIPKISDATATGPIASGSGSGMGKFGSMSGGGEESEDSVSGLGGFGASGQQGFGSAVSGAPPGYPGSSGGPPGGYTGGPSSGPPTGYPSGSGGPPGGYSGGPSSGPPAGLGGAPGGMGGFRLGGSTTSYLATSAEAPRELPSTKYKAIRFFDFEAKADRVYRYRVRLLMYDPNYPEYASIQPRSSSLDAGSGTLKRVQEMLDKERKELDARKADDGKPPYKRNSSRQTAWSEASPAISTVRTVAGYLGEPKMVYSFDRDRKAYESSAPRADLVVAEWDAINAIYVPRHDQVVRGYVFGQPNKEGGREVPFEIIHPISKLIKNLDPRESKNLATVIDLFGFLPLEAKVPKDSHLKSGAKGVIYDPVANRLVVLREFDDFTGYAMHKEPDKTAVGPLGGPLKGSGGTGGFGGGMGGPGKGLGKGLGGGPPGGVGAGPPGGIGGDLGGLSGEK